MVVIERTDIYGNKGYKRFERLKDAFKWLKSDSVKQDMEDGFKFEFKEEKNERDLKDGG